jgi:hypothetical protein
VTLFVGTINRDLATDEQFGQAEIDVKRLQQVEEGIAAAKEKALRDAEQLHALFASLDDANEQVRTARLDLQKQIDQQKKSVKAQLVADALNQINCTPRLRLKTYGSIVENSIKGKRTLDSMKKALDVIVGSLNKALAASKAEITEWEKANGETVPDAETLELEPADSVRLKLQARTRERENAKERKRLADEAEKERQARLKAEADAKANAAPSPAPVLENPPFAAPSESERFDAWDQQEQEVKAAMPAPAPTTPSPSSPDESEAEELARLCATIRAAFAPIKVARESLKHPQNILLAREFAAAVLPAYERLQKGGEG